MCCSVFRGQRLVSVSTWWLLFKWNIFFYVNNLPVIEGSTFLQLFSLPALSWFYIILKYITETKQALKNSSGIILKFAISLIHVQQDLDSPLQELFSRSFNTFSCHSRRKVKTAALQASQRFQYTLISHYIKPTDSWKEWQMAKV